MTDSANGSTVGNGSGGTELIELESASSKRTSALLPSHKSVNRWTKTLAKRRNDFVLSWENLSYVVKDNGSKDGDQNSFKNLCAPKRDKYVLKNLTGFLRPGQFLAIIGPSGSGKTSLLNVLAHRIKSSGDGRVEGRILVNGDPIHASNFRRVCGYVLQDDILLPFLTVRETLTFTAKLRLPRTYSDAEKLKRVNDVIEELGLTSCAETIIGNERVRGVSGGERKRVNIANELVADPAILFLDEATSGLDAFTALGVTNTLDTLAQNNYTVVCTIHQPRYNIFEMFDQLLILAEGEAVYFGPAKNAVAYFSSLNYPCPRFYNPPDHFMDLVTVDPHTEETVAASTARIEELAAAYRKSPMAEAAAHPEIPANSVHDYGVNRRRFDLVQFPVLLERSFRNTYRNKSLTIFRLIMDIGIGLVIGLAFLHLKFNQVGVQDRRGLLFILLVQEMWGALNIAMAIFPQDRAVFWKERGSGTYGVLVYYLAWQLVTLPATLFYPVVFSTIVYFMAGLKATAQNYFIAMASVEALNLCAEGLGLAVICWVPKRLPAMIVSLVVLLCFMLFGGYYLNTGTVPVFLLWMQWLSFVRYGFEAVMVNEFTGRTFSCEFAQQNITSWLSQNHLNTSDVFYNSSAGLIVDTFNPAIVFNNNSASLCPYLTGDDVLRSLSFSTQSTVVLRDIVVMLGMGLFYRILAYFGLWVIKPVEDAFVGR